MNIMEINIRKIEKITIMLTTLLLISSVFSIQTISAGETSLNAASLIIPSINITASRQLVYDVNMTTPYLQNFTVCGSFYAQQIGEIGVNSLVVEYWFDSNIILNKTVRTFRDNEEYGAVKIDHVSVQLDAGTHRGRCYMYLISTKSATVQVQNLQFNMISNKTIHNTSTYTNLIPFNYTYSDTGSIYDFIPGVFFNSTCVHGNTSEFVSALTTITTTAQTYSAFYIKSNETGEESPYWERETSIGGTGSTSGNMIFSSLPTGLRNFTIWVMTSKGTTNINGTIWEQKLHDNASNNISNIHGSNTETYYSGHYQTSTWYKQQELTYNYTNGTGLFGEYQISFYDNWGFPSIIELKINTSDDSWSQSSLRTTTAATSDGNIPLTFIVPNITSNTTIQVWTRMKAGTMYTYDDSLSLFAVTLADIQHINIAPIFSNECPYNNSGDLPFKTNNTWNLTIEDIDDHPINWTIQTSPSIGNGSGVNDTSGVKSIVLINPIYNTTYTVYVNASDGYNATNATYTFNTYNDTRYIQITAQTSNLNVAETSTSVFNIIGIFIIISILITLIALLIKYDIVRW